LFAAVEREHDIALESDALSFPEESATEIAISSNFDLQRS
jgi:hypothetical protein